jgi:hypothetical protein
MIKKNNFQKELKKNTKLKTSWYSKLVEWVIKLGLPYRWQTTKNNEAKFSIIKNKNPNNEDKFLYRKSLKENSEGLNWKTK